MTIITVSRGTFSGGVSVAELVSEKLGYRCLSREELIEAAANRYRIRMDKLSEAVDEVPSIWDRWSLARGQYLTCLRAALVREVGSNNIVYHGHVGHLLLQGVPNILRLRITANMEFRIKSVMEQNHLIREKSIDYIKREDAKRAKWTKFLYEVDWNDPSCYDLVVNIDTLDVHDACELVVSAAKLEKFKTTPEIQKVLTDLILSTEVRAVLATNEGFIESGVNVEADGGIVTLSGRIETEDKADKIRKIVEKIPGVSGVNSKMRIRQVF